MKSLECHIESVSSILGTMGSHGRAKAGKDIVRVTLTMMMPHAKWIEQRSRKGGRPRRRLMV